ncbi:MAG: type III pantothenate kinase [Zoogloeaceae bacterium]|jgi:type III pantothenate kinase|nr:type III pantothenate kinase [Zoogloeaceae bacterium]
MRLCLDAGNSRLKWGLAHASGWHAQGALEWRRLAELGSVLTAAQAMPRAAFLACVADAEREAALTEMLTRHYPALTLTRLSATAAAAGVKNGYLRPETLGVDRWCALIGARQLEPRPCLVVTAGTATTIDSLDGEGNFVGGLILPGLEMMQMALAQGTARLPQAEGRYADFPRNTVDAMVTGCLEAHIGAVERAFHRLPDAACCFLSGGAAPRLESRLQIPLRHAQGLVLEGVRVLAR